MIKACNFPVFLTFKEHLHRTETAKHEREKALKCLHDLILLHENTFMLPHEILGEGRAILDCFNAPNKRYVNGVFDQIETRHGNSIETLADAVISSRHVEELTRPFSNNAPLSDFDLLNDDSIQDFLHKRLIIQLLCEHYISLNKGKSTGAISLDADLVDVIEDAKQDAMQVCDGNLGVVPEVIIQPIENDNIKNFVAGPLIRSWSHHAIVELSKNAMKASVERWENEPLIRREQLPPPVHIKVLRNHDHLSIQVIDEGAGLDEQQRRKAFHFASSSSNKRWDRLQAQQSYAAVRDPLGSLGVGLTISRLMLRVFGGDLELTQNNDHGCIATMKILYDDTFESHN